MLEIRPTDTCAEVRVYDSSIVSRSTQKPNGVILQRGDIYRHCDSGEDTQTLFDSTIESIDLQIFYARKRGYQLCNTKMKG